MKIVQINTTYNKGSIGRTTAELHEYLISSGHLSFVFTANYKNEEHNVFSIGNIVDHKIHSFLSKFMGLQGYFSHIPTLMLLHKLDAIKPDIVHLRNLHSNYINVPMLLRYLAKKDIATVLTLHDCWFLTGKCCYYTHVNCVKFISGCYKCPALKYDNISWFLDTSKKVWKEKKRLFENIPRLAVVGNSEWTTEQARKSYLKNSTILSRIYNWIDMESFYERETAELRSRLNIDNRDFVILGVSQGWSSRKGLDVFLSLAERLPEFKIVLVGSLQHSEGLPNNVISVGKTNDVDELCKYYSLADVFVNPSLQETFGKVSAESLCCGTPIIVNRATANPEIVGPNCGYIVSNNNIDEYVIYINEIMNNGKSYYSESCLRFAKNNFNKTTNIDLYMGVYDELLK